MKYYAQRGVSEWRLVNQSTDIKIDWIDKESIKYRLDGFSEIKLSGGIQCDTFKKLASQGINSYTLYRHRNVKNVEGEYIEIEEVFNDVQVTCVKETESQSEIGKLTLLARF